MSWKPMNFFYRNQNLSCSRRSPGRSAFTLLELLVVIAIIAILAGAALPAFRGFGESNVLQSAQRQLLDALSFARLKAINERTTVYVLFVPPGQDDPSLVKREGTSFAIYASRSVGDQPGQNTPRFLTEWESLPDGMIICPDQFELPSGSAPALPPEQILLQRINPGSNPVRYFYYPPNRPETPEINRDIEFAFVAFDPRGKLIRTDGLPQQDQFICFQRGSVLYDQYLSDSDLPELQGMGKPGTSEIIPEPNSPMNYIRINWLTGRASLVEPPAP